MTHTQALREGGKFISGLVAADLVMGLWLLASGGLPETVFGIWVTVPFASFWVGFDVFVLLALIQYSWHPKALEPHMSSKILFSVVGVIMGAVAIIHFFRLVYSWTVMIDGWFVPIWFSWIGVLVATYLSYMSFHLAFRRRA